MSTLSITSPGVQINEVDLSLLARPIGATDVLITGFAPQGPTEQIINVGSVSEFESIFGTPTNGTERYLYYTAKQILSQSPANLLVNRMPYGSNMGEGYANSYSALVYQISSNAGKYSDSTEFKLLPPVSLLLTDDQYYKMISEKISWKDTAYQYSEGTKTTPFGSPLTNATSAISMGQRYYAAQTAAISALSQEELENLGFIGYAQLDNVYGYMIGEFTNWSSSAQTSAIETTSIYNAASAAAGLQTINNVWSYVYTAEEDPSYQALYGDSTMFFQLTSYTFDYGVFLDPINSFEDVENGFGGFIVVNYAKTAVNNYYEGYYVAIADNSNFNPATTYDSVRSVKAVSDTSSPQSFIEVPKARMNFTLTQTASAFEKDSLSKVMEQYPTGYDFSTPAFNDSLVLVLYRIKSTQYSQDTIELDYRVVEGYGGSFYGNRTQNNPLGGNPISFFIDNVVNKSSANLRAFTNPFLATQGNWTNADGTPAKKFRVDDSAKAAYSVGVYTVYNGLDNTDIGRLDLKLSRFLDVLANDETTNIDIVADAGLSTIWATAKAKAFDDNTTSYIFDETYTPDDIDNANGIGNTNVNVVPEGVTIEAYQAITQRFVAFAEAKRDHVFISDPLRQIFVRGKNAKTGSKKSFIFSSEIYWPLNNIYSPIQSSYVATYGNWLKTNDVYSDQGVWIPPSGYVTAVIARSSQATFPWIAPAGFNRASLVNVTDIAVNPTQKQRDLLYKINVNPIAFFNQDGYVIFGQKTMYRKPSAFDRINVRRLFLTLEKSTQRLLKYYVFEPNSFATRNRLKGALTPIFDQAKLNDGCYDYLIVCDTTNNTPDVIDNNELKVSIYIQPVRAAEFILADFIATRTGVNFSELIAGGQS